MKFRLPRKTKKRIKKMGILFYPLDSDNFYRLAKPYLLEEDYKVFKENKLINILREKTTKLDNIDRPIYVSDDTLLSYVNEIFAKEYRTTSYNKLIRCKNNKEAIKAYYNFINSYNRYKDGDRSMSNVCCLSVDYADKLLNQTKK